MILSENCKYVIILSHGELPELGGILGPIRRPTEVQIPKLVSMLNRGKEIYDVNPKNTKEMVRLTMANVKKDNFNKNVKKEAGTEIRSTSVTLKQDAKNVSTVSKQELTKNMKQDANNTPTKSDTKMSLSDFSKK